MPENIAFPDIAICVRHDERIKQVADAIIEQKEMLSAILETMAKLSSYNVEVSRKVHAAVFGNGNPGLIKEVTLLRERTESRKEQHDRDVRRIEMILCWGGSTMVITMIGMIGYLFALHFGGR